MDAAWNRSADAESGVQSYRVQLSGSPTFDTIVADRDTGTDVGTLRFTSTDGVSYGRRYYFRVLARDVAGNASPWSVPSNEDDVRDGATGPAIAHAPVLTANYGQPIPISAVSECDDGTTCTGWLYYRTTTAEAPYNVNVSLPGSGFQRVSLTRTSVTQLNGHGAVQWSGYIPGTFVTTQGVDYYLEADERFASAMYPGSTYVGVSPAPSVQGTGGYVHVHVVATPTTVHRPPMFAAVDQPLHLDVQLPCATGACSATVFFRTTDTDITQTERVEETNGELLALPGWPSLPFQETSAIPLRESGELLTLGVDIPASYVDSRGVDYFIQVADGNTNTWLPGSTYEGYYLALDGMRTGYFHVRGLETTHIVHQPVLTANYRQPIPIVATVNCPATRICTGTVHYRASSDALAADPFTDAPMALTARSVTGTGTDLVTLAGTIPSTATDTRGLDYYISVTDGATTSYWPGASANDGYVLIDGTSVGYQNIRVLEPPHFAHVPVGEASSGQPLVVQTELTCATEACSAVLHYVRGDQPGSVIDAPMVLTAVALQSVATRVETWSATIPASDVTPAGISYYMTASDGYVHAAAPGTSYNGAYEPLDGQTVPDSQGSAVTFPVHVI